MATNNLLKYIAERVDHYRVFYQLKTGSSFMLWYAIEALDLDQDQAYEAVVYDHGNDKSIDLFYIDDEYERIVIGQGKYQKNGRYLAKSGEFLELIHTTDWLNDPNALERDGRPDLAAAARDYIDAIRRGFSVEYVYVYMGPYKKDVEDAATLFNSSEVGNLPAKSARVVDISLLEHVHDEYIDKATRIASENLVFNSAEAFEQTGSFGKALVASISGSELKRLYETYGYALFDRNVRLFLGARKGSVNAGIRDTLNSTKDRKNFWAYNNGITIICDRYDYEEGRVSLHNFSIVNGCQTTVSVASSSPSVVKDVSILARFISSPQEAVVDSVITYTNRQTPIQPWDISSQDKNQKRLKKEFAEDPHPYLYILRRGEQAQLGAEEKKRFTRHGKLQVVPLDLLAQYLGAFNGLPVVAYKDKSKLFSTQRDAVFPSDLRIEQAILAWQAGEVAEASVRESISQAASREDQEEVRILRRGGKLFVVATMAIILRQRNGGIYLNKLKRDVAGSKATRDRLGKYASASVVWYVQAMKDLLATGADLSQVVRSQDFFPRVRDRILSMWKIQSMSEAWLKDALPKL